MSRVVRRGAALPLVLVRAYHPMKNGGFPKLCTKKNVHKRFRLTPNGRIKYWPSQLSGKVSSDVNVRACGTLTKGGTAQARFVVPKGNFKHLAHLLLPSFGCRSKWTQAKPRKRDLVDVLMAAKKRFKQVRGRDLTKDELVKVATAIKSARIEGNRVLPGPEGLLRFQ